MIWSIETDDFKGIGGTKFPILKAISQALGVKLVQNWKILELPIIWF
jgi:hypothetical protein